MQQQQKFITTLGLIVSLSGLPCVVAAAEGAAEREATGVSAVVTHSAAGDESTPAQSRPPVTSPSYKLSLDEMDRVSAGAIKPFYSWLFNVCPDCVVSLIMDHGVNIYE
jgi:hypothetical protein